MDRLSLNDPVFATYAIAATIMILKAISMSWLTVLRMTQEKGGFRSPEDIRKTRLNPDPDPRQLKPNERARFDEAVNDGKGQMPSWAGVLSAEEIDEIWAYIRSRADG